MVSFKNICLQKETLDWNLLIELFNFNSSYHFILSIISLWISKKLIIFIGELGHSAHFPAVGSIPIIIVQKRMEYCQESRLKSFRLLEYWVGTVGFRLPEPGSAWKLSACTSCYVIIDSNDRLSLLITVFHHFFISTKTSSVWNRKLQVYS